MVRGVVWPAIPDERASQLLAMQFQLEQSQWLSPKEIQFRQMRQFAELYMHATRTVPFYQRRFRELKLQPAQFSLGDHWSQIPILTRSDIQQAGSDLHCADPSLEHGPLTSTTTTGSCGQPVTTLGTSVTRMFFNVLLLRQHIWHRRDLSQKLCAIRAHPANTPREQSADNWGQGTFEIAKTGPVASLDVRAPVEEQADFLLRHDPAYLLTYPSIVADLADYFQRKELRLNKLRDVRTFGEVVEPRVRAACRNAWGVKLVDNYSAQEIGDIALQCPDHEHYHVQSETVLVEVVDDDGNPGKPGETGRILVTSLHNFGMPLIRYDIGDYGELGEPCPCGRGLPVLKRIMGRQRNMFILPDGRRVWPALEISIDEIRQDMPPVQQFQVIQRTRSQVELLLVTPRLLTEHEVETVRTWLDRALGCRLDLKITYVQQIPRGPGGKYEDFRCEVDVR